MNYAFQYLFVAAMLLLAVVFVVQGDIAQSLSQFAGWLKVRVGPFTSRAWKKLRTLRHIRRLVNVPFHLYLHRRTRLMPFCLGQVWNGAGFHCIRIIGRATNGDFVVQLDESIEVLESSAKLRARVENEALYLYEWDQSIDYTPLITAFDGVQAVVLKRY